MLEIPLVKPASQSTDATRSSGHRSGDTEDDIGEDLTFDTAYGESETEAESLVSTNEDTTLPAETEAELEGSSVPETSEEVLPAAESDDTPIVPADSFDSNVADPDTGLAAAPGTAEPDVDAEPAEAARVDRKLPVTQDGVIQAKSPNADNATEPAAPKTSPQTPLENVVAARVADSGLTARQTKNPPKTAVPQLSEMATDKSLPDVRGLHTSRHTPEMIDSQTNAPLERADTKKFKDFAEDRLMRTEPSLRGETNVNRPVTKRTTGTLANPSVSLKPLTALQALSEAADAPKSIVMDADGVVPVESRPVATSSPTTFGQIFARAETPGLIARQMAEALQRLPDRPVEIALNPRELGRVRMSISAAETGITVSMIAERPETLDLMKRNIDQLTVEFESIGYSNINFAFAEGEAQTGFTDPKDADSDAAPAVITLEMQDDDLPSLSQVRISDGVDIRL